MMYELYIFVGNRQQPNNSNLKKWNFFYLWLSVIHLCNAKNQKWEQLECDGQTNKLETRFREIVGSIVAILFVRTFVINLHVTHEYISCEHQIARYGLPYFGKEKDISMNWLYRKGNLESTSRQASFIV